jgi:2,3,4,5-tetrahydropyridine-2-carboxylate N-succinyltransferase
LSPSTLPDEIDALWLRGPKLAPGDRAVHDVVMHAVDLLERGEARAARVDPVTDQIWVDERAKRAILLAFRVLGMTGSSAGPFEYSDRIPVKREFPGVRVVPGAIARRGSYHAPGVVLMPSFTNIGAYIARGTLVDTWATVGSCAQIGRNVHISGGVGIGGVLEPPGAVPVVIEDECFIGSRSLVVEGARVRVGAKLGAGVVFTGSTPVFDTQSGEALPRGEVPPWSVCVNGTRQRAFPGGVFGLSCLLVVKQLVAGEVHDKLAIDALFREHGSAN